MVQKVKEGWGFPLGGSSPRKGEKAHYFVNDGSLCFDWHFYGDHLEQDLSPKCADCEKKLAKRSGTG
jgi:hypothetical protein